MLEFVCHARLVNIVKKLQVSAYFVRPVTFRHFLTPSNAILVLRERRVAVEPLNVTTVPSVSLVGPLHLNVTQLVLQERSSQHR